MESKKSIDIPSLFLFDNTNNDFTNKNNKKKEHSSKKCLDKIEAPSLFSNRIQFASASSYSLKNDLKSKVLKLKVNEKLEITKNGLEGTFDLDKEYPINENILKNQELSNDYLNICNKINDREKSPKNNILLENSNKNIEINKVIEENDMSTYFLNNSSCDLTMTYPKTSTQLFPERQPSFSISEISNTTNETTSSDTFEKKILSSDFISTYKTQASLPLKEYKEIDEHKSVKAIRNKACRSTLQGHDCECCSGYYSALQLKTPEKMQRINEVSRHRGIKSKHEKTPEGYWDKTFLEKSEQRKRGLFVESNSPIKTKRYRRKLTFSEEIDNVGERNSMRIKNKYFFFSFSMAGNQKRLGELQIILEEQVKKFETMQKERDMNITKRQQLEAQLTENQMVQREFKLLNDDASVYKLIGQALIKQDLNESKDNIEKRLEYIGGEIKRVDKYLEEIPEKLKNQQDEIKKTQMMIGAIRT